MALWYKLYIRETQEKVIPGSFYASRLVNLPLIGRNQTESGRRKQILCFCFSLSSDFVSKVIFQKQVTMAIKRNSPWNGRPPSLLLDLESPETAPLSKEKEEKPSRIKRNGQQKNKESKYMSIPLDIVVAVLTWYLLGVGSICTTKMLLMNKYAVPPLVLTFQQLLIGSTLLRIRLFITGGIQPIPENNPKNTQSIYYDFVLAGLFNALDFLASNTSFSQSSASFVETIKAAEPLTTTAIALFFGIDTLSFNEGISMCVLIVGVFLSTMANATGDSVSYNTQNFHQSIKTCIVVMTANLCFALRAKSQKLFRAYPEGKFIDDGNLLMRMQQIGAVSMLIPLIMFEIPGILERAINTNWTIFCHYWFLAVVNAACFSTYCLASCYTLSKLSVIQYTGFNCLRRMFAIIFTSIVFGVPITMLSAVGILLVFAGFIRLQQSRQ